MLVDKGLMFDVTTVGHHHILLGGTCPYLTGARVMETSGAGMTGQSTNKGCVSNVMSTEVSSI